MRHRSLSVTLLLLAGLASVPANAQQLVTKRYQGVVTSVVGAQSDAVAVGDDISVAYTLNALAVDLDASRDGGLFLDGLVHMAAQLPASGLAISGGAGEVYVFDNMEDMGDQVSINTSIFGSPVLLQGLEVMSVELLFSGGWDMVTSGALPLHRLVGKSVLLIFTDKGATIVTFQPTAEPTVPDLVEDGMLRLQVAMASGQLTRGPGLALAGKLERLRQTFEAAQAKLSCVTLASFEAQLRGLARGRLLNASLAVEMQALAQELDRALGQCQELRFKEGGGN